MPITPLPGLRHGISVRTRIAASVALLCALALATAGTLVLSLESNRIEQVTSRKIDQEIAELAAFQRDGIDPATGSPFRSVQPLLATYLRRNVPDDAEMLVAFWGGAPAQRTPHPHGAVVVEDPAFAQTVKRLQEAGGTSVERSPAFGEYRITVQPVSDTAGRGALVIVNFLAEERAELDRVIRTYALVSVVLLGLVVAAAWLQAGRLLRPLRVLHDEARDLSASDLSRRLPVSGNDDITRLTEQFNEMLARLEESFTSQREFLDDAGHELRTPLTVLRGHLELLDHADPTEVEQTRTLLLDEIDRMSRLVTDLILLAKSGRPDFVDPQPTDLGALVASVHRKATALGQREWMLAPIEGGMSAEVDDQRITQALLQLCDNAVKHTRDGDRITLAARTASHGRPPGPERAGAARQHVDLIVEDTGSGVATADRDRIFERFGRATTAEHDEGFGLGLSIVTAIAEAHGGGVHVEDAEGGGARFVLRLPTGRSSTWPES